MPLVVHAFYVLPPGTPKTAILSITRTRRTVPTSRKETTAVAKRQSASAVLGRSLESKTGRDSPGLGVGPATRSLLMR